jgi:two-component system, OmpR family, phosphate regulon sensor histidine kinase PhoR
LLSRWRQQLRQLPSARNLDTPTLNDHIPKFLEELAAALESGFDETISEVLSEGSPPSHGSQRFEDGFDIVEVVAEYNLLRDCIHELADQNGLILRVRPLHVINRVFDDAIGLAVKTFSIQRALDVQRRREEYLAFVAHDLRTPPSAISMAASVLELKFAGQGLVIGQMLKTLRRNAQHLKELVGKVLEENANLQTEVGIKLERRLIDLWPLVEALIHDLHPIAGTNSTQLINGVPDDLVVYADATLLRRVFQNLIANAIKYTPRGEIRLEARDLGPDAAIECSVSDNGAGIPLALHEKIFDKGETDPQNVGGTGLGLAIVKTFVEAHGGTIAVESKEGIGSTFRFSLPNRSR